MSFSDGFYRIFNVRKMEKIRHLLAQPSQHFKDEEWMKRAYSHDKEFILFQVCILERRASAVVIFSAKAG